MVERDDEFFFNRQKPFGGHYGISTLCGGHFVPELNPRVLLPGLLRVLRLTTLLPPQLLL